MVRRFLLAAMVAALLPPAAAAAPPGCAVPSDVVAPASALSRVAEDVAAGVPVRVLVVGSGSSLGSKGIKPYPEALSEPLSAALGGARVEVANRSSRNRTVSAQEAQLANDLPSVAPVSLVVWETGTTDAIGGADPVELSLTLSRGVAALREAGIGLVLVDPQYSAQTASIFNFDPMVEVITQTGQAEDVPVFRRYEIMRHLSDTGQFDPGAESRAGQLHQANQVHACLAWLLADFIAKAAKTTP